MGTLTCRRCLERPADETGLCPECLELARDRADEAEARAAADGALLALGGDAR